MRGNQAAAIVLAAFCFAAAAFAGCPTITPGPPILPDATLNQSYTQLLNVTGGTPPYTYMLRAGTVLPPGIRLFSDRLIGTPTQAGSFSFQIVATDANSCTGISSYNLKVKDPNAATCPPFTVAPASLPSGTVGALYSQRIIVGGGSSPYNFALGKGSLPPGLGLSGNLITGFPNAAGRFSFELVVTDSKGCTGTQGYDFEVVDAGCPPQDSPIILEPVSGAMFDGTKPVGFSWTPVTAANGYEVLVSNDNGLTLTTAATTSNNNTTASVMLPAGSFIAVVRAIFSAACATRSASTKFTVTGPTPCATTGPTLVAPKNGAANLDPSVTFAWTNVPNATSYSLFTSSNGAAFDQTANTSESSITRIMPAGTIDWYVQADFATCASLKSAVSRFTVAQPQCPVGAITLVAPQNGATATAPVTFTWTGISGASAYRIWIGVNGAPPTIIARSSTTTGSLPLPSGTIEWYVEALFDDCPSILSSHGTFTVSKAATCNNTAPVVVSPLRGDTSSPVDFTWTASPNAIGYRVWLSSSDLALTELGFTTDTHLKRDVPPESYSWYVDALFNGCPAVASAPSTFNIPDTATCGGSPPVLISPADGTLGVQSPVTLSWTAVPNAKEYHVFASLDTGPLQLLGTTTDHTLKVSIPPGGVAWVVEATFKGCAATHSATGRFTVPRANTCPTDKPQLISPARGANDVTTPVTFSWSAVSGAVRYVVVAKSSNGAATAIGETSVTQLQRDVPAETVEWFVVALGAGCDPIASDHATFTVPTPPGCDGKRPHLLSPADDSVNVASPVLFAWTKVAHATSYRVFAAIDGDEPAPVGTTSATEITLPMPSGSIRWFVEAISDTCPALFSSLSDVTIAGKPSGCSAPDRPAAHVVAQVLSATAYNVRWTGVTNATVYELQESLSADFSNATTTTTSRVSATFNHTATTAAVQYFYRVRAVSSCSDDRSAFSRTVSTRVIPPNTLGTRTRGTAEIGVQNTVVQTLNLPGQATPVTFTATTDKPWLRVTPSSGTLPTTGLTLIVTSDPTALNVGANHGTVHITYGSTGGSGRIETNASTPPKNVPVSISLVTAVAPDTKASPPPDSLFIPAVAHGPGLNSLFQSDVRLANTSSQAMKYLLNFTPTAMDGTQTGTTTTVQVDPGATIALDDLLSSFFGTATEGSATGMLEIRPLTTSSSSSIFSTVPSSAFATVASSRTYNVTPLGTFGQFIPAIPFSQFVGKGSVLSLQQIAQSSAYRTNFGLVEASGEPANVMLHVYDKAGNLLADIPESLLPSEHRQINGLLTVNNITLDDGRIEVEVLSSTGKVSAYASVLANDSNDPFLVSGVLKSAVKSNRYVIPGVAYSNGIANWRTDARLYNAASTSVNATLTYYPQGAPGSPLARTITIAAGEVRGLDNILNSLFGITDPSSGGSVLVTTAATSNIIASARTYTPTDIGTVGQFIPAVTPADSVGSADRSLQLLQLEQSDAFRTNIGLAETTGNPATVEVSLLLPDSKVTPVITFPLAANEFVQFSLASYGLTDSIYNARASVKVVDGNGKVTAYGSLVDNASKDPTYVPAQ